MSEELKTTNANQTEPDTQPEDNGDKNQSGSGTERTFTQDEVNKIIKERLQRERSKAGAEQQQHEAEKTAELTAKENRLTCKEYLLDNGYPQKLLDIIDTSDPEEFKRKAADAASAFASGSGSGSGEKPYTQHRFVQSEYNPDHIAEAFSLDAKHKPKNKYN